MPVYYKINSNTPYIVSEFKFTGSTLEKIDLFYKIKKESENIYKGKIDNNLIFQSNFKQDIVKYLKERKFLQTLYITESYSPSDYQFPKCCWLADSLLTGSFDNPLSIHYNPRIQQNVVHPGQSRSYISRLFQKEKIDCLYFNTSGVKFPWMKSLVPVSKDELTKLNFYIFSLAADHGSLIPHVYFGNQEDTFQHVFKYHNLIKSRLSNMQFRIKSNVVIDPLEYWTTSDPNTHIEIYIKDVNNDDDVVRACILAILGKPYVSETLKVTINPLR
jgi:hypothetical protein